MGKDTYCDREVKMWCKKLQRLMDKMPPGIEAVVIYNSIDIYPSGRLSAHLDSPQGGFGIGDDGTRISSINTDERVIPYGESL